MEKWVVVQERLKIATLMFACAGLLFLAKSSRVNAAEPGPNYQILQKNAMAMARSGEYPPAIAILEKILQQHPQDKRVKRDLMAVYSWTGDCRHAFSLYRQFSRDDIDDRVSIAAISDCLIKDERYLEANALLTPAREKYGYDRKILDLYLQARQQLAEHKHWYNYNGLEVSGSDIGGDAISFESELSREVSDATSLFARIKLAHEHSPTFGDGTLKRLGAGFEHRFYNGIFWRSEASANLEGAANSGLTNRLEYAYNDNVKVSGEYTTFAEDISLPAIGLGITSDRFQIGSEFHNDGYAFKGSVSAAQYQFSDSNLRQDVSVDLSYAYSRVDERWRRIGLAIDHETNTYAAATYYNPSDANSVVVYHSWEIPGRSKRVKHNDKLTLKAGVVAEAGYNTAAISEALYEQKFEVSEDSSISISYSLASNVYAGVREADATVAFSYERSF
jgi:tetratricopeptide (TPR) repeat protein